jgi:hypothetical protein
VILYALFVVALVFCLSIVPLSTQPLVALICIVALCEVFAHAVICILCILAHSVLVFVMIGHLCEYFSCWISFLGQFILGWMHYCGKIWLFVHFFCDIFSESVILIYFRRIVLKHAFLFVFSRKIPNNNSDD